MQEALHQSLSAIASQLPARLTGATFYKWRSKYGRMEMSEAKRLKALEEENPKLKKLLAEQMLVVATFKEMLVKNL